MIEKTKGDFTLLYDPITDNANLLFRRHLLVANSPQPNCWTVIHGPAWFEFECSTKRRRHRFGSDLRGQLNHVRAMAGRAKDVISELHHLVEMKDLQGWDRWWKSRVVA